MILIVLAGAALIVFLMLRQNRLEKEKYLRKKAGEYGTPGFRRFLPGEIERLSFLSRNRAHTGFGLSDLTWQDLGMDDLFGAISRCSSSPGDEVLLSWLRNPELDPEHLKERGRLIRTMEEQEELRRQAVFLLGKVGSIRDHSFAELMEKLADAPRIRRTPYLLAGLTIPAALVILLIFPVPGILLLIAALGLNLVLSMRARETSDFYLRGIDCVLRMLQCAGALKKLPFPEDTDIAGRLAEEESALQSFRRGSGIVVSSAGTGTGADSVILQYLNLFFHLDLLRLDRMVEIFTEKKEVCFDLLADLGTVDAAISAASFRAALPVFCEPEWNAGTVGKEKGMRTEMNRDGQVQIAVTITDMIHPLIKNPVPNSMKAEGGNLITGSNASGKSTFLKNLGICAVLAQSIFTVPAKAYRGPLLRVATSMSVSDSILGGESYFMAEIRAVKALLDLTEAKETPALVMIDEVLRGTNTIERIAASSQILKALKKPGVIVFAATHDRELTEILKEEYKNWHFEEVITDGDVHFSYRIGEGSAKSRNAIRLLRTLGFDPKLADAAEAEAVRFEQKGVWSL